MNSFNEKHTKELQRKLLERFDTAFAYENIFTKRRNEMLKAFNGVSFYIPWYLVPFKKMVMSIALYAFEKGIEEVKKDDTVTVKRPNQYKGKL